MTNEFAQCFAHEWIAAWNSHDLQNILAHYEDDFEMSSPIIPVLAGEPSGKLRGKAAIGAYWAQALRKLPNLHFELVTVLAGVDSVTIYYKGQRASRLVRGSSAFRPRRQCASGLCPLRSAVAVAKTQEGSEPRSRPCPTRRHAESPRIS